MQRDLARLGCHLWPIADPAKMARIAQCHDGYSVASTLLDAQSSSLFTDGLTESILAIDHGDNVVLKGNLNGAIGKNLARLEPFHVRHHADHAVGIVADKIRLGQSSRDPLSLDHLASRRLENGGDQCT